MCGHLLQLFMPFTVVSNDLRIHSGKNKHCRKHCALQSVIQQCFIYAGNGEGAEVRRIQHPGYREEQEGVH